MVLASFLNIALLFNSRKYEDSIDGHMTDKDSTH
jgi:hypothetical protein